MKNISSLHVAPSSPPSNVTGNPVDSTTVVLSWMALLPAHHNGIIRYYSVNLTETDTGDQIQTESETTTKLLSSLHPYYTYKVAVAAVTVASGPYSTPVTFQLPEDGTFMLLLFYAYSIHTLKQLQVGLQLTSVLRHSLPTLSKLLGTLPH